MSPSIRRAFLLSPIADDISLKIGSAVRIGDAASGASHCTALYRALAVEWRMQIRSPEINPLINHRRRPVLAVECQAHFDFQRAGPASGRIFPPCGALAEGGFLPNRSGEVRSFVTIRLTAPHRLSRQRPGLAMGPPLDNRKLFAPSPQIFSTVGGGAPAEKVHGSFSSLDAEELRGQG